MIKTTMFGATLALVGMAVTPSASHAQDRKPVLDGPVASDTTLARATVRLLVDGMVCPFCAYGLEKRLGELAAVDSVVVRISDGVVFIREHARHELTREALRQEIEKAGFTLREMLRLDR